MYVGGNQNHPQEKTRNKAKWLSEADLQVYLRNEEKRKAKEKGKDIPI